MSSPFSFEPIAKIASKYLSIEQDKPALTPLDKETLKDDFDLAIQANPLKSDKDFWDMIENISLNTPNMSGRRFYNQLFGGRNNPAIAADMLTSFFNNSMYTYKVGGIHIAIEKEMLALFMEYAGFENSSATIVPGWLNGEYGGHVGGKKSA